MRQERPTSAFTPPSDACALLQAVACPVLQVGTDGRVRWANSAAVRALAVFAGQEATTLWQEPVHAASQAVQAVRDSHRCQLEIAKLPDGCSLWTLQSTQALHDTQAQLTHEQELMGLAPRVDGLTLDEARALVHPDDLPALMASAQAALQTPDPVECEARYRHADGSWRSQMLRRTVLRDDQGQATAFLGVALDITDRIEERRQTHELMRRLETVTRVAGVGHWVHEPGRLNPVWSDQMRAMFGLTESVSGPDVRHWLSQYVHPDDRAALRQALREWSAAGPGNLESTFRVVRAPGDVRQYKSHSTAERTERGMLRFGVVIDITDQKQFEKALRGAEERISLAVRGLGLGTWHYDVDAGLTEWDPQMWLLRGRDPQPRAMTAEERLACVHPADRERIGQWITQLVDSDNLLENQVRVVWPNGQVRWLATRSRTTVDAEGQRRRIGVNWDITNTITAETAHRERELALLDSQAKSQFMARMSHELRTPLNAVLGFAQLLQSEESGEDPASATRRRRLEHIRSAGQHLLTLINDVLDLSALAGGEVRVAHEPVSLLAVFQSSLPLLGPLLEHGGIAVHADSLDFTVLSDSTRLRQVLLNLLSNAIKYNRPGGHVTVGAKSLGARVILRIADTGRGMGEAQQRHLFEPFNRLGVNSDGIEGTGIGLAIVKALVQRMGGEIQVKQPAGRRHRF